MLATVRESENSTRRRTSRKWMIRTQSTLPGIDHAWFHATTTESTPVTCNSGPVPLCEYPCSSRPSCARSVMLRGQACVTGSVAMQKKRSAVERGKSAMTKKTGVWTCGRIGRGRGGPLG